MSEPDGVFPAQALSAAIDAEWIGSGDYRIRSEAIQPASVDLRLGDFAWALRCSFLPDVDSTVEEKIEGLAFQKIDLRDGAVLERDRPYLVPLIEELALPEDVRGKANPKSSTGRLDVFTRVITDRNHRFDEIRPGYEGKLYLEIVPRSFAIQVQTGLAAEPAAAVRGRRPPRRRGDPQPARGVPAPLPRLPRAARVRAGARRRALPQRRPVAGRATESSATGPSKNSLPIDLSRVRAYRWTRLLGPGPARAGRADRARAGDLLPAAIGGGRRASRRRYAAEMMAYDPTAGELRTHYAGFFDPGFGYDPRGRPARHAGRRSRCAPATSPSWSSTASRLQARLRADARAARRASTATTSARTTRARRRCSVSTSSGSPDKAADPLAAGQQLLLELLDLLPPPPHQLELVADVAEALLEDLPPPHRVLDAAMPLAAQGGAGVLGLDQLLQLLERDAEQVAQPQQLVEPLDVALVVCPMGAGLASPARGSRPISS